MTSVLLGHYDGDDDDDANSIPPQLRRIIL